MLFFVNQPKISQPHPLLDAHRPVYNYPMIFYIVRAIIRFGIWLIADVEVHGLENIDLKRPGLLVATNHLGRLDAALVYILLDRPDILLPIAEKYRTSLFWRVVSRALNTIFIDRYNADIAALRACLNTIKKGGVVVLAPEGTRSPTSSLQEGKPGVCYIASKAGVPITPVGLWGSEDHLLDANLKRLRRSHITVNIGPAFTLPKLESRERAAALERDTTEMMCHIAALLPPSYRGIYADLQRTQELLSRAETAAPSTAAASSLA